MHLLRLRPYIKREVTGKFRLRATRFGKVIVEIQVIDTKFETPASGEPLPDPVTYWKKANRDEIPWYGSLELSPVKD